VNSHHGKQGRNYFSFDVKEVNSVLCLMNEKAHVTLIEQFSTIIPILEMHNKITILSLSLSLSLYIYIYIYE